MQIKDWASCPNQAKLYRELAELDLLENIAELDMFGFTVVSPENVAPPKFHARVKEALIDVMEVRFGPLSDDGMSWQDLNRQVVTGEALARNPLRFAGLMDVYGAFPFGKQDFDLDRAQEASAVSSGVPDASPYLSLFDREPAGERVSLRPDYDYHAFDLDAYRQKQERMLALAQEMAGKTENGEAE